MNILNRDIIMISFLTAYRDGLKQRPRITIEFFEMMEDHLKRKNSLESIICDHGSTDDIKDVLESYSHLTYLYVPPTDDQFLNMSKCFNAGCFNANNQIIAPLGLDMRLSIDTITFLIEVFYTLGNVIVRPLMIQKQKDDGEHLTYTPYLMLRDTIYKLGGWDERMIGWGKEDDDLMDRAVKYELIGEFRIRKLYFGYLHLWHEKKFCLANDSQDEHPNLKYYIENLNSNGKNLVNSYWTRK